MILVFLLMAALLSVSSQDSPLLFHEITRISRTPDFLGYQPEYFSFDTTGDRLVASNSDNTIKIWDVTTGTELLTYRGHTDFVFSAVFNPDGTRIASGAYDHTIQVWDTFTGETLFRFDDVPGDSVAWSPNGEYLAFAQGSGMSVWNLTTNELVFNGDNWGIIYDIDWSPDGQYIAAANGWDNDFLHIWTARGERFDTFWAGGQVAWSPDSTQIASATQIRDLSTGLPAIIIPNLEGLISWHPDGKWLASTQDGDIYIWDAHTGRQLAVISADCTAIRGLAWSYNHLAASCLKAEPNLANQIIIWGW